MKNEKFSALRRLKSFYHAIKGIKILIREEHNIRIQLLLMLIALLFGLFLKISAIEWVAVAFAIGFVLAAESFNSAIERVADFISPEKNELIKNIKDVSAAGVLISAIVSLIIGFIVFLPKMIQLL